MKSVFDGIDPARLTPVPQEDIERFRESMQKNVIEPIEERRRKAFIRAEKWRRYMLENDPPCT
jgi:hypothetical protein